ncbi:hypothetical protein SFC08_05165 [Lysinibacillus halotolerans]|nr:hypothetical protein [Ureibacillus galli]
MKKLRILALVAVLSTVISATASAAPQEVSTNGAPFACTGPCLDR